MSDVTPALSAEVWAEYADDFADPAVYADGEHRVRVAIFRETGQVNIWGTRHANNGAVVVTGAQHAIIAALNHSLPEDHHGKITKADVDAILRGAQVIADEYRGTAIGDAAEKHTVPRLHALAAKLRALLTYKDQVGG